MNVKYERYLADMEKFGASKPWMDEKEYLIAIGEYEDEIAIPLVIKPKYVKPFVEPTLEGNIKGKRPSKPKIVRTTSKPKTPKLSDEQLKINRLINNRKYQERKRRERGAPPRVFLTPEEDKQKKKEYMKVWRDKNRETINAAAAQWKRENREKHLSYNRQWASKNPESVKATQKRWYEKHKGIKL